MVNPSEEFLDAICEALVAKREEEHRQAIESMRTHCMIVPDGYAKDWRKREKRLTNASFGVNVFTPGGIYAKYGNDHA